MPLSSKQKRYIKKYHAKLSAQKISTDVKADVGAVKTYIESLQPNISPRKKFIFSIIALSLPLLFFILLELVLRIFGYGGKLDLFITAPGEYSHYKMCNPYVGRRFFFMQSNIPDPSNDIFLKEKPENGYRIFVLGGSTTAGYPYGENMMFTRILHHRLSEVFPDRHIEVVNTATAAINSYSLLDFTDEIMENEPDAILIYAGHNEFYGAFGVASTESLGKFRWIVKLYLNFKKFKTFILIRDLIGQLRKLVAKILYSGSVSDPSATLMERLVGDQKIVYGNTIYELGKDQFRRNLRDILKKATAGGVQLLVSELVSNVRDHKPFISIETEVLPPADEVYRVAQNLERENKLEEAKEKYYQAKDLDALRFRASEEFNEIIYQVCSEFEVPVVSLKAIFESASPNGLIGNNLMLEHLHPNIDGYFLMAEVFFESMRKNHFISEKWDSQKIESSSQFRNRWGVTQLDSLYGDLRIRILKGGWPFKPMSVPNRALADYRKTNKAESLAVQIWTDKKMTLERGHVEMARYFSKRKQHDLAFQEYNALICLTPYNISPYLEAANSLIKARNLQRALPILFKSLKVEETAYAYKWIGQILLDENRVKESLVYLEKAYKTNSTDPQLLYNLSGAYALSAQYEKAQEVLDKLYAINPGFPDAEILQRQLDQILKK